MANYLRGDKKQLAGGKIIIPSQEVTKDNVVHFQNEFKDALNPR